MLMTFYKEQMKRWFLMNIYIYMASDSDENYALNEFDLVRLRKAFSDEIRYFYSFLFMWIVNEVQYTYLKHLELSVVCYM